MLNLSAKYYSTITKRLYDTLEQLQSEESKLTTSISSSDSYEFVLNQIDELRKEYNKNLNELRKAYDERLVTLISQLDSLTTITTTTLIN